MNPLWQTMSLLIFLLRPKAKCHKYGHIWFYMVSPLSAIPHKSKAFRMILDLSFSLKLTPKGRVLSVNEKSEKTAPGYTIDQIGHLLLILIHVFSEAPEGDNIFLKMGYQGWDFEARLQGGIRIKFLQSSLNINLA